MREIFIEKNENLRRIAIKENGRLIECRIEEESNEPLPGEIYKGIVKNLVPAIKSAFVDIGYEKNAYMYLGEELIKTIKNGDDVMTEVIKEELNDKGAKVSPFINLPGRYAVLTNMDTLIRFSQKIDDDKFKDDMFRELTGLVPMGIKLRTQSVNAEKDAVKREILSLYEKYKDIERKCKFSVKPQKIYDGGSILNRVLRDFVNDDTKRIVVDSMEDYKLIDNYMQDKEDMQADLKMYDGHRNLFDYSGIEKDILMLRNPRINLKCGGSIVIERTEAMYVIDVNSGKNIKSHTMETTAFNTNSEAAEEIARQIRLRNLSGIIVIDFIDMHDEIHQNKVIDILEKGFRGDKNKTVVFEPTELNLVQIARRRMGKSIYDYIEEDCRECHGHGKKLKLSYIKLLIRNEILKKDAESSIKDIYIEVNSLYETAVREDMFAFIRDIEALHKNIYLKFGEDVEYFKVEPLIFKNQIDSLKDYKISIDNL